MKGKEVVWSNTDSNETYCDRTKGQPSARMPYLLRWEGGKLRGCEAGRKWRVLTPDEEGAEAINKNGVFSNQLLVTEKERHKLHVIQPKQCQDKEIVEIRNLAINARNKDYRSDKKKAFH